MSQKKMNDVTFYTSKISPPCRFVHMVIKHLNINCNIKEMDLFGGEHKTPEFLAVNPAGQVPTLKDGDFNLGESRAIACYLCNKYAPNDQLYPTSPDARAKVDQVLYADMGFINAMFRFAEPFQVFFLNQIPSYSDDSGVKKAFALYESFLGDNKYLAGDHLTLADLSGANSIAVLDLCKYEKFEKFPRLKEWLDRMKKLPFYKECTAEPSKELATFYEKKIKALKEGKK